MGAEHQDTLVSQGNLAQLLVRTGRLTEAEALMQKQLQLSRAELGDRHPHTLVSVSNLAGLLREQGRLYAAPHSNDLVETRRRRPSSCPHVTIACRRRASHGSCARLIRTADPHREESLPLLREEVALSTDTLGEGHRDTRAALHGLACCLEKLGHLEEALELCRTLHGATHPRTLRVIAGLAADLDGQGRAEDATKLRNELLAAISMKQSV